MIRMEYFWVLILSYCFLCNGYDTINFTLFEEKPASTLVGNIATETGLAANMSAEEFASLQYNFLDQTKTSSLFVINNDNGNIYTSVVIDRETECSFKEVCVLTFDVMVRWSITTDYDIISVNIRLEDINDKSPIFQPNSVTRQISESSAIGTLIGIEEARDSDSSDKNRIQNYTILPKNGPFGLNVTRKREGGHILKLVLTKNLNREQADSYLVRVVAFDGGQHPNSGTLTITMEITDDNDNSPAFTQDIYQVTVDEGVRRGTQVVHVQAIDSDIGQNAEIVYRFSSFQTVLTLEEVNKFFAINGTSGEITIVGELKYESGKVYEINVEASDKGQQPRVSQAKVIVTVLDVGNNPPSVRVNFLSAGSSGAVNVSEAAKSGTVIAHVNVVDTDSGQNGNVTCSLSDSSFVLEIVKGKGYVVLIHSALNRETKAFHNVSVMCRDNGTPVLMTSAHFLVYIQDENDNPPKFTQATYFTEIQENNAIGDIITTVSAHDADAGRNAFIRYYLNSSDSHNRFAINSISGVITANERFDRENVVYYRFSVIAVDNGNPPMTGSSTIVLNISDANDNPPLFDVAVFQFFARENMSPNSTVGTLSATDVDIGKNGEVLFKLSQSTSRTFPFHVLQDGTIKTSHSLDREYISRYTFKVLAYDLGLPSKSNEIDVIVDVNDENDNAPVIVYPSTNNNTMTVSYLAPVGTLISSVKAYDLDEKGPNSHLIYSFIGGNDLGVFSIGKNTGKIFLKKTYRVQTDLTFAVSVEVSDKGDNSRKNVTHFYIVLKYSNGTFVEALEDAGNTNIIISVVVVCLTIILSAVIIAVICVLRHQDKKMKNSRQKKIEKTMYDEKVPEVIMEVKPDINGVLTSTADTPTKKKKKEVSFTLEDDNHQLSDSYSSSAFIGDKHNFKLNSNFHHDRIRPESIPNSHHQHFSQEKIPTSKQRTVSSTDNFSDSSGETTTADSGRGGSDLDLSHSHRADDVGSEYAKLQAPSALHHVHLPHFDNFIQHSHGHIQSEPYHVYCGDSSRLPKENYFPSYV